MTAVELEIVEGFLQFLTAAVQVRQQEDAPEAADAGTEYSAGTTLTFGPVETKGAGTRLDRIWIKENVAAAGAVARFNGVVRRPY